MTVQYRLVATPTLESVQRTETGQQPRVIAKRRLAARRPDNSPLWGRHGVNCLHSARAILCDLLGDEDFPEDLPRSFARWWLEDLEGSGHVLDAVELLGWLEDAVIHIGRFDMPHVAAVVVTVDAEWGFDLSATPAPRAIVTTKGRPN